MLLLLSPSKTLDYDSAVPDISCTTPRFLPQAEQLVTVLRHYSAPQLSQLMDISDRLSALNVSRYQHFSVPFTRDNARPCLFAFTGDVYEPMDISHYTPPQLAYAQAHLRILSGLYGLLRPLDLMQAYRLEMGTRLPVQGAKDLYQFWGDAISDALNADLAAQRQKVIINLASEEYVRAVRPERLSGELVHIVFKERHADGYRIVGVHAKKARGMMADHAIRGEIPHYEDLKKFTGGGYAFSSRFSTKNHWIFLR